MDDADTYHPEPKFVEDKKDPLIDLELTDSTELWLIQWPSNQINDFDGQSVSLKLEGDGHIGNFESSSGKSYEMFTMKSQASPETVFLSSTTKAKIAGKISKHVSLIHYPEASELQKRNSLYLGQSRSSMMTTSILSSQRLATPSRSVKHRNTPASSSRSKSAVTGSEESTKPLKRKRVDEQQDSGKTNSGVTSTGSMDESQIRKSKKKKKSEN